MNLYIDYQKRLARIRAEMETQGIDLLLATRMVSVTFVAGAFVPWRGAVLVGREGYVGLINFMIDLERIKSETWLENVTGYAPIPGMDMMDVAVRQIKENGWEKAVIGVELGHSPRGNTGYLFATEYEFLRQALPEAELVGAMNVIDRAAYIKEPAEIQLMRQATAMADSAIARVRESVEVGMTEAEVAGIGEAELRRLGSEYHWAVTGSTEVASGYRAAWAMNGTTQPTDKIIQEGENLIVDFHPMYRTFLSDLTHNFFLGKPNKEQVKLADAYLKAVETLIGALRAGATVGSVWSAVNEQVTSSGYAAHTLPFFGHGLGVSGHEWYPPIGNAAEVRDIVFEENVVEVGFLSMTVPGIGGLRLECPILVTPSGGEPLSRTPLGMTVIDV
ncbi:MAG: aminopeptidase P family protein [Deltaproteobacteria bacterium]|nr:aminopeptidase P family protein [Candidatus Zymogenaceae bacterium]